jgi:hypothetical protein
MAYLPNIKYIIFLWDLVNNCLSEMLKQVEITLTAPFSTAEPQVCYRTLKNSKEVHGKRGP